MIGTRLGPVPDSVLPAYDGGCIAGIPHLILQSLGVPAPGDCCHLADVLPQAALDGVRSIVLIVLDGLGYRLLCRHVAENPSHPFAELIRRGHLTSISTVLPSTTAAALVSYSTGVTPQQHGLLGYRMFLREVGITANMINFSPHTSHAEFPNSQINAVQFVSQPTLYQILKSHGIPSAVLISRQYQHSALSRMLYRGSEIKPYVAAHDAFSLLRQMLIGPAPERRLWHLYWDELDVVQHHYGPASSVVGDCLHALGYSLLRALDGVHAPGVLLLISADHGLVETRESHCINLRHHPTLMQMLLSPPCGDARLPYLHAQADRVPEVEAYLLSQFGHAAAVVPSREALQAGWFGHGPIHPEAPSRLGQFVLVPREDWKFIYPTTSEDRDAIGRHGGMDPEEMEVPLLAIRL